VDDCSSFFASWCESGVRVWLASEQGDLENENKAKLATRWMEVGERQVAVGWWTESAKRMLVEQTLRCTVDSNHWWRSRASTWELKSVPLQDLHMPA
jgi:hypothetical protein